MSLQVENGSRLLTFFVHLLLASQIPLGVGMRVPAAKPPIYLHSVNIVALGHVEMCRQLDNGQFAFALAKLACITLDNRPGQPRRQDRRASKLSR